MRAPLVEGIRDSTGAMNFGALATMQDVTGAVVALPAVQPDWIATSNLSLNLLEPLRGDGVLVRCHCVRKGSKSVVIECETFSIDGDTLDGGRVADEPSAVGLMLFARIPGSASVAEPTYSDSTGWSPLRSNQATDLGRFDERLNITSTDAGSELEADAYVANSFGTVNGGAQCALASAEAERISGGGWLTTDLTLHYLSQVGDGPLVAVGDLLRSGDGDAVVQVRMHDAANDRAIAIATVHCAAG
jgi:acyl-coenzyme A thioesterase PaaI-like protein